MSIHSRIVIKTVQNFAIFKSEEIKAASNLSNTEIKEIKTAIHQTPKTYANAVANTNTEATPLTVQACVKRREMQEKLRKEREPYEIVLTTSNKETIEKLNTMHGRKITEQCQNTIDKSNATYKNQKHQTTTKKTKKQ